MRGTTGLCIGTVVFRWCSNDLHRSIGDNSVKLYADDTAIITSNPNLKSVLYQAKGIVYKIVSLVYCK